MPYVPRFTAPSPSDKWWRTISSGGVNPCLHIRNGSVLPNCFSGQTEIVTSYGKQRLKDIVGQSLEILTINNTWNTATIQYFGKQPLWEVTMSNGNIYHASANHRWLVWNKDSYRIVTTCELLPYMAIKVQDMSHTDMVYIEKCKPLNIIDDVYCPVEPVTHTCTLGGGELTGQCVGYAWGRFAEIQNAPCRSLPTANASDWWELAKGFKKGQTPKLGAVAVWGKTGQPGHVEIVEKVNPDGSCVTSSSSYAGTWFYTETIYPPKYSRSGGYYLKGFIYHPYVSDDETISTSSSSTSNKVSQFLNEAMSHLKEGNSWTCKLSGCPTTFPWCAAFVVAVATAVGVIGKVIYKSYNSGTMVREGLKRKYGTYYRGAYWGESNQPKPGDLVIYRWHASSAYAGQDEYTADHVGIVREVRNGSIYTVEGNCSNRVSTNRYSINYHCILGYFRPDWSRVGGSAEADSDVAYEAEPLYESKSTREDATVREVSYITDAGEPSISMTGLRLSVINYTSVLAALVSIPSAVLADSSKVKVDTSRLKMTNAKTICDYFLKKGLTISQCIGILANMRAESNLRPGAVNRSSGAAGLCQWFAGRKESMIQHVGSNWKSNLSGQLDYLWYELNNSEKSTLAALREIKGQSEDAAIRCAKSFCKTFERPGDLVTAYDIRSEFASGFWKQVTVVSNSRTASPGSSKQLTTRSGKVLSKGRDVNLPSTITQPVTLSSSFNYNYNVSKTKMSGHKQDLAKIWTQSGRSSTRNIATIGNYYLCATTSAIGKVGDVIKLVMTNGVKISALICDNFSSTNTWGRPNGASVYVIDWARKGTANNSTDSAVKLDLTGWRNAKIQKIVNYGTYLD